MNKEIASRRNTGCFGETMVDEQKEGGEEDVTDSFAGVNFDDMFKELAGGTDENPP